MGKIQSRLAVRKTGEDAREGGTGRKNAEEEGCEKTVAGSEFIRSPYKSQEVERHEKKWEENAGFAAYLENVRPLDKKSGNFGEVLHPLPLAAAQ